MIRILVLLAVSSCISAKTDYISDVRSLADIMYSRKLRPSKLFNIQPAPRNPVLIDEIRRKPSFTGLYKRNRKTYELIINDIAENEIVRPQVRFISNGGPVIKTEEAQNTVYSEPEVTKQDSTHFEEIHADKIESQDAGITIAPNLTKNNGDIHTEEDVKDDRITNGTTEQIDTTTEIHEEQDMNEDPAIEDTPEETNAVEEIYVDEAQQTTSNDEKSKVLDNDINQGTSLDDSGVIKDSVIPSKEHSEERDSDKTDNVLKVDEEEPTKDKFSPDQGNRVESPVYKFKIPSKPWYFQNYNPFLIKNYFYIP